MPLPEDSIIGVLKLYAEEGRVRELENIMATSLTGTRVFGDEPLSFELTDPSISNDTTTASTRQGAH